MTCDACGREHVIIGQILVDGVQVHPGLIETMVEMGCRHDLLRARDPEPETLVEPDVEPRDTKRPDR